MAWGDRAAEQHEKDQPSGYAPCLLHEITNCSVCSGLDKRTKDFTPTGRQEWPAQHPGECPKCGEFFDAGTLIVATDNGWICCP